MGIGRANGGRLSGDDQAERGGNSSAFCTLMLRRPALPRAGQSGAADTTLR